MQKYAKILQNLKLWTECPDFCSNFTNKGKAAVPVPETGYNKNSESEITELQQFQVQTEKQLQTRVFQKDTSFHFA